MSSLLRSTKFMRYFTGAARTLILNSAKTTEANLLINSKALSCVNNVLMREYATSKKAESLEPLLQKLDSEVRRFGRITKRDIDEVFDELQSKNDITSSQSLLVIRCCGELVPEELPEQRTLLVQKIWSVLTERGIPMDISHYNALLRVYLENEHPFSPAKFLEELEKKGLQPNRVTYQRLMWRYCQEGDVDGATKVLEKMRELKMPVSEPVLNALVMGHAFHGDTDGAKAVLETMANAGLQPTNHTYTLLACGYAKKGDIEGVESVIKTAAEKEVLLIDRDILSIIEHLASSSHGDKVEQLFPHLQKGIGYNQEVCNLILRLLNKDQYETAKKVMKTMPKSINNDDTPFKGAFFVKQLLRHNKSPENVIKICRELKDENLVPMALYIATENALQLGKSEHALLLFKELQRDGLEIRQHYYWPLLAQKGKENDEEGLLQIMREMSANNIMPSGETLRDYVIPYLVKKDTPENVVLKLQIANVPLILGSRSLMVELLESGDIKKAATIATKYRLRGQYSLVARPLLNALNKTKDIDSFITILHVTSSKAQTAALEDDSANDDVQNDSADSNEVARIVKSAVKILSKPELCEKLLEGLLSKGLRINVEAAETIEQYLGENMSSKLSKLLSELTALDLELAPVESQRRSLGTRSTIELERLLAKIKSSGGTNINRIQKQLLMAYIKENNVDKVNSFLEELKQSDFDLSTLTLAQLFEFYCDNNEIEKAKQIQAQIIEKNPDFVMNKYKLVQMAFALIRNNKYDEAVRYLQDNKQEESDNQKFMLNSKCWQLLNTLAEQKDDVKVKEMCKVLIENNYIEPSNVMLGPLIKVNLLKDDIDSALKEFEYCCNQYRSTPWKGELMKRLIMQEDASKLQWLADLSTQIHGEVNILHDLVLAFVECGRLRQARRILETPGLQTKHKRLEDACQRYVDEGKSEYLEGLLEATKELSHIDRSNIFYQLLVTYCKANETDKALGLWTLLQEEGEVPSEQFLSHLGHHLKANNRPVPFVLANEKPIISSRRKETVVPKKKEKPAVPTLTKKNVTDNLEELIKQEKFDEAMDVTMKSIKEGVTPKTNVIKFLLKNLAEKGNVDKIQVLGNQINDSMRRRISYDDKLTLAVFTRGGGPQHVDDLYETVQAAKSVEDLEIAIKKFPRSTALASIMNNEDMVTKCYKVAETAAEKGFLLPMNLLWMEYILAGREQLADEIWNKWLTNTPSLMFRRLLQESHLKKQPQNIEKLISALKSNKEVTPNSIGNAYSRLINYYLLENKLEDAEKVLESALKEGFSTENLNKTTLLKLKSAVETVGRQFNHTI